MAQAAAQQPFKFGSKGTSVDWDEVAKSSECWLLQGFPTCKMPQVRALGEKVGSLLDADADAAVETVRP